MSAPRNPPRAPGSARRRASYTNPNLRISDAERAEAADRLSKHYSDGRLDQAAFNERLDQAMAARTQSDLNGLFDDLPGTDASAAVTPRRHRHGHGRLLALVLVVVITAAVGDALARSFVPWLLIGLLAFFWLRYGQWHHHRPEKRDSSGSSPG